MVLKSWTLIFGDRGFVFLHVLVEPGGLDLSKFYMYRWNRFDKKMLVSHVVCFLCE